MNSLSNEVEIASFSVLINNLFSIGGVLSIFGLIVTLPLLILNNTSHHWGCSSKAGFVTPAIKPGLFYNYI